MDKVDRARGCLLGGALGDALGAPVEFLSWSEIQRRFGSHGIQELTESYGVHAAITDDTQMTLFSAEGMIRAYVRAVGRGVCHPPGVVAYAYLRWLATQGYNVNHFAFDGRSFLFEERRLHHRRAPGNTCLAALQTYDQTREPVHNDSKGCGTVMRAAPFGFFRNSAKMAGDCSDLTHSHPEARASSMAFAEIISKLAAGQPLQNAIRSGLRVISRASRTSEVLKLAQSLAATETEPQEAFRQLGEGWVAEEALAIGVFCALRAESDFLNGIRMAVNHGGDSDSTGSICGNLIGAAYGIEIIPPSWIEQLELAELIDEVARDMVLVQEGRISEWEEKYPGG